MLILVVQQAQQIRVIFCGLTLKSITWTSKKRTQIRHPLCETKPADINKTNRHARRPLLTKNKPLTQT